MSFFREIGTDGYDSDANKSEKEIGKNLMGKVKQQLEEDMMLNPENYNNPTEEEMSSSSQQKEEIDDFIKQHIIIGTIKDETSRK